MTCFLMNLSKWILQKDSSTNLIQKDVYQGLLLPQVATHCGWNRETFLDQTCVKAGLPEGSWKDPSVKIKIFSAQIFSEAEFIEK